jgi:hypothetical protein
MDQEVAKLKIEIGRLKRRVIWLEDAIKKIHALTDPPALQRIRAGEETR